MNVLIVGASGGIGHGVVKRLLEESTRAPSQIFATYMSTPPHEHNSRIKWLHLDATDETQVKQLAKSLPPLTWVINCVGVLHNSSIFPEKSIRQFTPDAFAYAMNVNALPSLLLAKHFGCKLKSDHCAVFAAISAKVGSIEDNQLGGWHSYRMSKAALNMALKTISIEWARTMPKVCVAALHPGTTATELSRPFQKNVVPEKLFSTEQTAGYLVDVLQKLTPDTTGRFWSWDGSDIPW